MKKFLIIFLALVALTVWLLVPKRPLPDQGLRITKTMIITSSAFADGKTIPDQYGCRGDNVNPPLEIKNTPTDAKSLALIMDDPDSPSGLWAHWLVWNIDPATLVLAPNQVPFGAVQGKNSFGNVNYGGPCPGSGTHHYEFKVYALDATLDLPAGVTENQLLSAMSGHILAQGLLVGLYSH
jgi:hypothetical protein